MKVKIKNLGDARRIVFIRKYKNTKMPEILLREYRGFKIEPRNASCLIFMECLIEIFIYDELMKEWKWQEIGREK